MSYWRVREELSNAERLRRSYYELLRDELDQFILDYGLTESYKSFMDRNQPYPFVEMRELKPRTRIPNIEYEGLNSFLVIFVEDSIPEEHKKYIRFFDMNKTTKTNLVQAKSLSLKKRFDRNQKYLESVQFFNFLRKLLPIDYALLIQRDGSSSARDRYCLSHFHVKIDWPIADAAENLGRRLRYISKNLYEKGDKYAEDLQKKLFEYYGLPFMVGGRRTAAIVAAQYLKQIPCITTIYAGSSESRAVFRISERGASKAILIRLSRQEIIQIAEANQITPQRFTNNYVVDYDGDLAVCIFQATYGYTEHSRPPEDGKLRDINTDPYWLTVSGQHILPKPDIWKCSPLPLNVIYS